MPLVPMRQLLDAAAAGGYGVGAAPCSPSPGEIDQWIVAERMIHFGQAGRVM